MAHSEQLGRSCTHAGVSADSAVHRPLTMLTSNRNRAGLVPVDHAKANREAIKQQSRANRERKVLALHQSGRPVPTAILPCSGSIAVVTSIATGSQRRLPTMYLPLDACACTARCSGSPRRQTPCGGQRLGRQGDPGGGAPVSGRHPARLPTASTGADTSSVRRIGAEA